MRDGQEVELVTLEPDLKGRFRFGILAPENGSTLDPAALTRALFDQCVADGAKVVRARATDLRVKGGPVPGVTLDSRETPGTACGGSAGGGWGGRRC